MRSLRDGLKRIASLAAIAIVAAAVVLLGLSGVGSRDGSVTLAPSTAAPPTATPPAPGAVSFIAFGDAGQGSSEQLEVRDEMRRLAGSYQLGLLLGDGAYPSGTVADYDARFFPAYNGLFQGQGQPPGPPTTGSPKPLFTTPGSHDEGGSGGEPGYRTVFDMPLNGPAGQEMYSFNVGPVHFLSFDSAYLTDPETPPVDKAAAEAWMIKDLDRYRDRVSVVFDHDPAYAAGTGENEPDVQAVRDTWFALAAAHGADVFLSGHVHAYERNLPQAGLTSYIAGGGGGNIPDAAPDRQFPGGPATAATLSYYGFLEVSIGGCEIRTDYRLPDGSRFDPWSYVAPTCTASTAASAAPPVASGSTPGRPILRDAFESDGLAGWQVTTAAGGQAVIQGTTVASGRQAVLLSESSGTGSLAFMSAPLRGAGSDFTVALKVDVLETGLPRSNVPLVTLLDPDGRRLLQVYRQNLASGKVYVDLPGAVPRPLRYQLTRGEIAPDTWVLLEVHVHLAGTSSEVDVHLDGAGVYEATGLRLGSSVASLELGNDVAAQRFALAADDVSVTVP